MDRRDALKAFGSLMATAGVTITPVVSHDGGTDIAMVFLKIPGPIAEAQGRAISECWKAGTAGTLLEGIRVVILPDGIDVEIVRAKKGARGDG